ncbi:MAG: signal peptidase II [Actinomycetota bacterium]|nr:signal peptidase II [Actinomycetota bacterium]
MPRSSQPSSSPASSGDAPSADSGDPSGRGSDQPDRLEGPEDGHRSSPYPRLLITALLVLVVDQATKTLALLKLQRGPVDVIEGVFSFDLSFNPGGVFGIGQGWPELFLVATVVVVAGILFWARQIEHRSWLIPLGLVLGGGLGNVTDRIFRGFEGRVVDFIDLHVWPVFNVADMAIVTGVGLVLLMSFRSER